MEKHEYRIIFAGWVIATIATLGSLFFSNVMGFVPCSLCWFQRIFMYPLVFIFLVGLLKSDKNVFNHALPFVIIGWSIALYHNLIQLNVIPESASPCVQGVPCSAKYINWLGFITIPLMSFIAFSILAILIYSRRYFNESTK
jgi:disulfide bond formation protein DsbB